MEFNKESIEEANTDILRKEASLNNCFISLMAGGKYSVTMDASDMLTNNLHNKVDVKFFGCPNVHIPRDSETALKNFPCFYNTKRGYPLVLENVCVENLYFSKCKIEDIANFNRACLLYKQSKAKIGNVLLYSVALILARREVHIEANVVDDRNNKFLLSTLVLYIEDIRAVIY